MQNLFLHIAYLLARHECVILPGLGAFVVYESGSVYVKESGVFTAPCLSVGFNPEIQHNDGLLAGILMKERGLNYKDAVRLTERFCGELQASLQMGSKMEIPGVGSLQLTEEGKYVFSQTSVHPVSNASFCGFVTFHLPKLEDIKELPVVTNLPESEFSEESGEKKNVVLVPVNKRFFKGAGIVAAALLSLLLLSTPIENKSAPEQYANVLFSFNHSSLDKPVATFRVVAGSFSSKDDADKALVKISGNYKDAVVLTDSDQFLICLKQFEDKADAERYLDSLQAMPADFDPARIMEYLPERR